MAQLCPYALEDILHKKLPQAAKGEIKQLGFHFKFVFKIQHILLESPLCKLYEYSLGEWILCASIYPLIRF